MFLQLDGHGPLHSQITRALRGIIVDGRLAEGSQLPSTRLLADELGVSRNTILATYEQLRVEGLVTSRIGSGSFVAAIGQRRAAAPRLSVTPPQSRYAWRGREIHHHDAMPGRVIPGTRFAFQHGEPLINPALTSTWSRELARAATYTNHSYPRAQGLPILREAICDYLGRRRGVLAEPKNVLIVSGTQQAIALTARVVLDEGSAVAIEDPQYFAIREVLQIHGTSICGVPVDRDGLITASLPDSSPRLICVTPSHQFPSGSVLSLDRRLALLDYAEQRQSWIFEDDYDGEFRYGSKPIAALQSLDRNDRVIYVGTFSKVLFPAIRLGYIVMPEGLRTDFINAKWADDFGSNSVEQAALANFMNTGGFERHLRRTALALQERRNTLLKGLLECGRGRLEISDSHAGMHIVVWMRDRTALQGDSFISRALERGLGLYSIAPHFISAPDRAGLVMGFAALSTTEIKEALKIFGALIDEEYE